MGILLYDKKERFNELVKKDNTKENDIERKALFTIFAESDELYRTVNELYDFEEHAINLDYLEEDNLLSRSSNLLLKIAFNLYSSDNEVNLTKTFDGLNSEDYKTALKGMSVRFKQDDDIQK